jgi:hypothetical protein
VLHEHVILGLPVAADEIHLVFEGAVGTDAAGAFLVEKLGDERPAMRAGGVGQQGLKRDADGSFVKRALEFELLERAVVRVDGSKERFAWFGRDNRTPFKLPAAL